MSLLLRGDSEAEKSHSRSLIKSLRVRILNFKDRAATMDITDLNVFAWCACLKHLGKTIMILVVGAIIGLACYATFSSALLPGIENGNAAAKFGYILLSIMYITTVFMVLWTYIATMVTDPGTTPPGWHPFQLTHQHHNHNHINDVESGTSGVPNFEDLASSLHDPLIAVPLSDHYQTSTRQELQHCRSSSHRNRTTTTTTSTNGISGGTDNTEEEQELDVEGEGDPYYDAALALMGRPRWCKKCSAWKPPRSHHDSMTRRCVLKMDHYCVWVGNTVGLLNYKNFVLFLFWASLGCIMSAALLIKPTISFFSARDPALRPMITSFLAFVFTAAFSVALLGFVIMHLRLVFINQSTIEAYEKRPVQPWPYDRGWENNFIDVFGTQKKLWFLPVVPEEHKKRLLAETLSGVPVPLPAGNAWQEARNTTFDLSHTNGVSGSGVGGGNANSTVAFGQHSGRAQSPSDESVGSDLGMVLIERPTTI